MARGAVGLRTLVVLLLMVQASCPFFFIIAPLLGKEQKQSFPVLHSLFLKRDNNRLLNLYHLVSSLFRGNGAK